MKLKLPVFPTLLVLFSFSAWAAKAPVGKEELKKTATHIFTGEVVDVQSKETKSKIEKGLGIHTDRIYTIKIKIASVKKGKGVAVGDEIIVEAWRPAKRIPPEPGLQGHESIPKKGGHVTIFVKEVNGKKFKPILPNGIEILEEPQKPATAKNE
ncbi:MAG: hypothetical protein HKN23_15120 [Verrucomicrobiales bacterium]|nr:hypothetical protein [Verrucomicrobiales bacterium]